MFSDPFLVGALQQKFAIATSRRRPVTPGTRAPFAHRSGPRAWLWSSTAGADNLVCNSRCSYVQVKMCRVNRLVTEHLVSQSPLPHSVCLLSTYTLKIKYSSLEQ
jgi:hypothetical protein